MSNQESKPTESRPVIVVGAGMAGIATAWELSRLGIPVRIIEKTPRVGGRIHSVQQHGGTLETGMEFYYSAYAETRKLLARANLTRHLAAIPIRGLIYWQGRTGRFSKTKPWLGLLSTRENLKLWFSIARKVFSLIAAPLFDFRKGDSVDNIDCADYFMRHGGKAVLELAVRPMVNSYAFTEPEGHSLAMLLRIIKLGALAKTFGLVMGNDALPKSLAESLSVLHANVSAVNIANGRVDSVTTDRDGTPQTLAASHVVLAVPAPRAAEILKSMRLISQPLAGLAYSSIVLANLFLDRPLVGPDWVYVFSRDAGHKAAFAIDLARRVPRMFPEGKSVVQVNFASPVSDALLKESDDEIVRHGLSDLSAFFPRVGEWVKDASVVRRPDTHPSFKVGMFEQIRLIEEDVAATRGLHLAGDYLRAPLCEGAVRSGFACAHRIASNRIQSIR